MKYAIIKAVFAMCIIVTFGSGYVCLNLSQNNDKSAGVYAAIFVIGIFVCYFMSFFTHDPNDGKDY